MPFNNSQLMANLLHPSYTFHPRPQRLCTKEAKSRHCIFRRRDFNVLNTVASVNEILVVGLQRGESFTDVTFGTPVFLGQWPPHPQPGKGWASAICYHCCLLRRQWPIPPNLPRGWSQKSALHCRFAEMMFWKVEWLGTSSLSPLLWNSDTERPQSNKKVLLTCHVCTSSASESPLCHTPELWYLA